MPENPVGHVAAEARTQSALAVLVNKWIGAFGIIQAFHQILKRCPTPIAVHRIDELLPIARRSMEIDHYHHIPVGREEFGIPAIAPVIPPRSLRPPMKEELDRLFLVGIEVRRLDKESLNFIVSRAREPEGFKRRHCHPSQHSMIEIGELHFAFFHARSLASLRLNLPTRIRANLLRFENGRSRRSSSNATSLCQCSPKDFVREPDRHAGK